MSISNEFADALVDDLRHQKSVVERLSGELHTLQSKLTEIEQVLEWASENVWLQRWPERSHEERWTAYPLGISKWHNAPTLYDALHQAWVARDTTKDL